METLTYIDYGLYFVAMLLGVAAHMIKKLANLNKQGTLLKPQEYFAKYPYQTSLALIGGVAGYFVMLSTGDLSFLTALLYGYAADSVFERKLPS